MTDPRTTRPDLAGMVEELTTRHTHREHYTVRQGKTWFGRDHLTTVPPLITQLWDAPEPAATAEEGPRAGFRSKPAARLEALDVAVRIDLEASRWVRDLGEDDPSDTVDCVRRLHALTASAHWCRKGKATKDGTGKVTCCTRHAIERDVRRWWLQARIITGWDSAPWKPDNTCPVCGERGTLRVNLAAQGGFCTHCRETWDEGTIGLLADHIRQESNAEREPKAPAEPCACPVPKPVVTGLVMCSRCGSARCVHALQRSKDQAAARARARDEAS